MYHHSCLSIILDACEQTEKEGAQRQETVETGKPDVVYIEDTT